MKTKKTKSSTPKKPSPSEAHIASAKRMNRVIGQAEGIRAMLLEARSADEILAQCKAVRSALKSVESQLMEERLQHLVDDIVTDEKKKSREEKIKALMRLVG